MAAQVLVSVNSSCHVAVNAARWEFAPRKKYATALVQLCLGDAIGAISDLVNEIQNPFGELLNNAPCLVTPDVVCGNYNDRRRHECCRQLSSGSG